MIFLTELQKEKTCACIEYQINRLSKRMDEIDNSKTPITDEKYEEYQNCQKAIFSYNRIIQAIKQD